MTKQEKKKFINAISDEYVDGESCLKIGRRYSLHESSIRYWLRKNGVKLRPPNRMSKTERSELGRKIEEYRRQGFKNYEIAQMCNRHANSISRVRPFGRKYMLPLTLNLYDSGASLRQIGKILDVDGSTVGYNLKKHLKVRSKGGPNNLKWRGKNIPCSNDCGGVAAVKGMCRTCYARFLNRKKRHKATWELMQQEQVYTLL